MNFLQQIQPAYPDEARYIVQRPIFSALLKEVNLAGAACLNAGCGEMLYFDLLDNIPGAGNIVHMDLETPKESTVRNNPRHSATPGSVTEIPFPDQTFGLVFCTEVIEHVPDDARAVKEISRVLQPGGLALISTPTPPAPHDPNHVREGYTLGQMTELLKSAGLTVLRHEYAFHGLFRSFYITWTWLRNVRGGYSAMPRFVLRGWSHAERVLPIGKPWDIAVLAKKA